MDASTGVDSSAARSRSRRGGLVRLDLNPGPTRKLSTMLSFTTYTAPEDHKHPAQPRSPGHTLIGILRRRPARSQAADHRPGDAGFSSRQLPAL
ncbi:hypothetical protein PGT21_031819 [Puccinia graminis f. sp. tritici]|uniref:Uncharacterized protein n=1 Tax=Puccinia graminis f. sp. tritici TaxID=56615 RepID=A0A5B0QCR8_PUCGR|nr:hypothetical protein PGT21_031819 [Puccinia graminis f. sp. tritici]